MQLEAQLAERGVTFELTKEATAWLAIKGYDERMGARPLSRVIQEHIKKPLAEEVLFGRLKTGGTVKVSLGKDKEGKEKIELEVIEDTPVKKPASKNRKKTIARSGQTKKTASSKAKGRGGTKSGEAADGGKNDRGGGGSVPKVPLKT